MSEESLPERVDADDARVLIAGGRVRVIDIRDAESFAEDRISGAVHVDEADLEGGVEPDRAGRDAVLVVCEDGERSAEVAASLREDGTEATSIDGGFEAWVSGGHSTAPGRDEEYEGPAVTVPGAVASSGGEEEDEEDDDDGESSG